MEPRKSCTSVSEKRAMLVVLLCIMHSTAVPLCAEIPIPADAPKPLSTADSAKAVELPDGFRLELIAAEPLIRNPSGVCWDERGRLFVWILPQSISSSMTYWLTRNGRTLATTCMAKRCSGSSLDTGSI